MTDDEDQLTCPECGDPLLLDEEWRITDRSLIGTEVGDEGIQGDYAHTRCLDVEVEEPSLSTYGGGLTEDPDAEVPDYEEVASDD